MQSIKQMDSVKVALRCRPLNQKETQLGESPVVRVKDSTHMVLSSPPVDSDTSTPSESPRGTPLGALNRKTSSRGTMKQIEQERLFQFDHCYGPESTQQQVFQDIGVGVLQNAFQGYNATVFAYGQTGSGKSHTMLGSKAEDGTLDAGLIPRICRALLCKVAMTQREQSTQSSQEDAAFSDCDEADSEDSELDEDFEDFQMLENKIKQQSRRQSLDTTQDTAFYKLEASYLEIYNEQCMDLLACQRNGSTNLKVREDPESGPYVEGLSKMSIETMEDINRILERGNAARTVKSTKSNSQSSRSHAIFTLVFTQTKVSPDLNGTVDIVSKINLVDLAGSERIDKAGIQGNMTVETRHINKSLFALGRVIELLSKASSEQENKENSGDSLHQVKSATSSRVGTPVKREKVPYRDSTLTFLLKPCLGGNSKTTMLATVTAAGSNYEETLSTLRYANTCSHITTSAVVNKDQKSGRVDELQAEIKQLRERLAQQDPMLAQLKFERAEEAARHDETRMELQSMKIQVNKLQTQVECSNSAMEIQAVDRDELKKMRAQLESQRKEMEAEAETIKRQHEISKMRVEGQIRDLERRERELVEEQKLKEKEHERVMTQHEHAREHAETKIGQLRKERDELEVLKNETESIRQEIETNRAEIAARERAVIKIKESAKESEHLKEQLAELEGQLQTVSKAKASLEAKHAEAIEDLKSSFQTEKQTLVENYQLEINQLNEQRERDMELGAEQQSKEILELVEQHAIDKSNMKMEHEAELKEAIEKTKAETAQQSQASSKRLKEMAKLHHDELLNREMEFDDQLAQAKEDLMVQMKKKKSVFDQELKQMKEEHETAMTELMEKHSTEIQSQLEQNNCTLKQLKEEAEQEKNTLMGDHQMQMDSKVKELETEFEQRLQAVEKSKEEAIEAERESYESKIALLCEQDSEKVKALSAQHSNAMSSFEADMKSAQEALMEDFNTQKATMEQEHKETVESMNTIYQEELEKLKQQLEDKSKELENHIQSTNDQIEQMKLGYTEKITSTEKSSNERATTLEDALSTTKSNLVAQEEETERYKVKLATLQEELEALNNQHESTLSSQQEEHQTKLDRLTEENEIEMSKVKREQDQLNIALEKVESELNKSKENVETLEKEIKQLTEENNSLAESRTQETIALAMKHKEHNTRQQSDFNEQLSKKTWDLQNLAIQHKTEMDNLKSKHEEAMNAANEEFTKKLAADLELQHVAFEDQKEQIEANHAEKIAELTAQWKSEEEQLNKCHNEEMDERQQDIDELQQTIDKLEENSVELQSKHAEEMKAAMEEATSREFTMKESIEALEFELKETISGYELALAESEEHHTGHEAEILINHQREMEEQREELTALYKEREEKLQREKRTVQRNLNEAKEKILELSQEMTGLISQLQEEEAKYVEILNTLRDLQSNRSKEVLDQIEIWLSSGIIVTKHPRQGAPKRRYCWVTKTGRYGTLQLHFGKNINTWGALRGDDKVVNLSEVVEVRKGCDTEVFRRTSELAEMKGMSTLVECCFSLITKKRSIDIECRNESMRDLLMNGFSKLVAAQREQMEDTIVDEDDDDNYTVDDSTIAGSQMCVGDLDARTQASRVSYQSTSTAGWGNDSVHGSSFRSSIRNNDYRNSFNRSNNNTPNTKIPLHAPIPHTTSGKKPTNRSKIIAAIMNSHSPY